MSEVEHARDYCAAEVMAAFISRDLKDGELGAIGTFSQIPWAAIHLAQETHAPNLWFWIGTGGSMNPKFPKLIWYVGDYRTQIGSESRLSTDTVIDMQGNERFLDFAFYGGFQIDKYGNLNMAYIGDQKKPKFRGPGTVGTMATAYLNRYYLFTNMHSPRLLVEKVDFISGPGFGDGPGWREKMGSPSRSQGPRYLITPIAVMDFEEETKQMRLKSVHPGHTVEEIQHRTGFKLIIPEKVPETEPPTVEELRILREFDPDRILPQLTQD